jgi:transposase
VLAFETFDGNRADVTAIGEMVQMMEAKYGKAHRVWVMDRGTVSEDNLEFMRTTKARYLVSTPRSYLKKFEQHLLDAPREEVAPGVEISLARSPEGMNETFVLCRSEGRREKENTILNRFVVGLEKKLIAVAEKADRGMIRDRQKLERQIGRLLERHNRAATNLAIAPILPREAP